MDINKMTRKQFEELPYLDEFKDHKFSSIEVDSIVLLPSRKHHDSGFNCYEVVLCNKWEAIGKCYGYDTFSIYMGNGFDRVGIDCLRGSGLMRIFLPRNEYKAVPIYHEIRRKPDEKTNKLIDNIVADKLMSPITKDMWDKWQEEMTKQIKGNIKGEENEKNNF